MEYYVNIDLTPDLIQMTQNFQSQWQMKLGFHILKHIAIYFQVHWSYRNIPDQEEDSALQIVAFPSDHTTQKKKIGEISQQGKRIAMKIMQHESSHLGTKKNKKYICTGKAFMTTSLTFSLIRFKSSLLAKS